MLRRRLRQSGCLLGLRTDRRRFARVDSRSTRAIGVGIGLGLRLTTFRGLAVRPRSKLDPRSSSPRQDSLSRDETSVKLIDFRHDLEATSASNAPSRIDDLGYRAPESFSSGYRPQPAADLYSLGAVMYRTLTGKIPFAGGNFEHLKNQIIETPLTPVASLVFDCPVWF